MPENWQDKIRSSSTQKGDISLVTWQVCSSAATEAGIPARMVELWAC